MGKRKHFITVILFGIILQISGVKGLPEGERVFVDCDKVIISHSGLNIRSLFNNYSNLRELEEESSCFEIDLNKNKEN